MNVKKLLAMTGVLVVIAVLGLFAVSGAFAQSSTPEAQATPAAPTKPEWGWGFGPWGGKSWADFDAAAAALNLTPTQLFEQLHSGKTLTEIAQAQGVDIQKVQDALNASRTQAMKDAINQAVKDGKISQAQADWMLQGLEQGFLGGGQGFGFGFGGRMHGGMRGLRGGAPEPAPSTTPGTSF